MLVNFRLLVPFGAILLEPQLNFKRLGEHFFDQLLGSQVNFDEAVLLDLIDTELGVAKRLSNLSLLVLNRHELRLVHLAHEGKGQIQVAVLLQFSGHLRDPLNILPLLSQELHEIYPKGVGLVFLSDV